MGGVLSGRRAWRCKVATLGPLYAASLSRPPDNQPQDGGAAQTIQTRAGQRGDDTDPCRAARRCPSCPSGIGRASCGSKERRRDAPRHERRPRGGGDALARAGLRSLARRGRSGLPARRRVFAVRARRVRAPCRVRARRPCLTRRSVDARPPGARLLEHMLGGTHYLCSVCSADCVHVLVCLYACILKRDKRNLPPKQKTCLYRNQ